MIGRVEGGEFHNSTFNIVEAEGFDGEHVEVKNDVKLRQASSNPLVMPSDLDTDVFKFEIVGDRHTEYEIVFKPKKIMLQDIDSMGTLRATKIESKETDIPTRYVFDPIFSVRRDPVEVKYGKMEFINGPYDAIPKDDVYYVELGDGNPYSLYDPFEVKVNEIKNGVSYKTDKVRAMHKYIIDNKLYGDSVEEYGADNFLKWYYNVESAGETYGGNQIDYSLGSIVNGVFTTPQTGSTVASNAAETRRKKSDGPVRKGFYEFYGDKIYDPVPIVSDFETYGNVGMPEHPFIYIGHDEDLYNEGDKVLMDTDNGLWEDRLYIYSETLDLNGKEESVYIKAEKDKSLYESDIITIERPVLMVSSETTFRSSPYNGYYTRVNHYLNRKITGGLSSTKKNTGSDLICPRLSYGAQMWSGKAGTGSEENKYVLTGTLRMVNSKVQETEGVIARFSRMAMPNKASTSWVRIEETPPREHEQSKLLLPLSMPGVPGPQGSSGIETGPNGEPATWYSGPLALHNYLQAMLKPVVDGIDEDLFEFDTEDILEYGKLKVDVDNDKYGLFTGGSSLIWDPYYDRLDQDLNDVNNKIFKPEGGMFDESNPLHNKDTFGIMTYRAIKDFSELYYDNGKNNNLNKIFEINNPKIQSLEFKGLEPSEGSYHWLNEGVVKKRGTGDIKYHKLLIELSSKREK